MALGDSALLKNKREESRKGGKLNTRYLGPYKVEPISEKGQVVTLNLHTAVQTVHG